MVKEYSNASLGRPFGSLHDITACKGLHTAITIYLESLFASKSVVSDQAQLGLLCIDSAHVAISIIRR